MKDLFNSVIPELVDIMKIQRCALFSVTEDRQHVILEAGYPEIQHGIGQVFSVKEHYIDAIVNQAEPSGEFENEKISSAYILINNPKESRLLPIGSQTVSGGSANSFGPLPPLKSERDGQIIFWFLMPKPNCDDLRRNRLRFLLFSERN